MPAFGFYEYLVTLFIGKTVNFIFDRRTITRSYAVYNSLKHRRAVKARTKDIVYALASVGHITIFLYGKRFGFWRKREFLRMLITWLRNHLGKIERTSIYTRWCTGFHTTSLKTVLHETFGKSVSSRFAYTTTTELFEPYVHHPIEESTIGEHHTFGFDSNP